MGKQDGEQPKKPDESDPPSSEARPTPLPDLHPPLADFKRDAVTQVIIDVTSKIQRIYSESFSNSARALRQTGDAASADAIEFLACVAQAMLKPSDVRRPFHPMFEWGNERGLIPDDFDDHQIDLIVDLAPTIGDPVLQARLFDFSWLRRRTQDHAVSAIAAYIRAAKRFMEIKSENDQHFEVISLQFIERALRLSYFALKKEERPAEPVQTLLDFGPSLFLKGKIGRVLLSEKLVYEFQLADLGERVVFIEEVADWASTNTNPHMARDVWLFATKLHNRLQNKDAEQVTRIKAAETMVTLSAHAASGENPSYIAAAAHLSDALKIFRQVREETARKEELREMLSRYQAKILDEMTSHSTEFDLFEASEKARERVSGLPLPQALTVLAFFINPSDPKKLREQVLELAKKFPLQYYMTISVADRDGRTVDMIPPLLAPEDEKEKEKALRYHSMRQADMGYSIIGGGTIEPARIQIYQEHYISPEVLRPLAEQSLFVPEGHEELFAKGLSAGLEGDYASALHILVPQLENSLRTFLKRQGYVVSTKEKDDKITQEAVTLRSILAHDSIKKEFGEGIHFDLESLLSDKLGLGIRHSIAHGFYGDSAYWQQGNTIYLFWLILRLVILPLIPADREGSK